MKVRVDVSAGAALRVRVRRGHLRVAGDNACWIAKPTSHRHTMCAAKVARCRKHGGLIRFRKQQVVFTTALVRPSRTARMHLGRGRTLSASALPSIRSREDGSSGGRRYRLYRY